MVGAFVVRAAAFLERFPYGRAPLAVLVLAVLAGLGELAVWQREREARPDLTLVTFTQLHQRMYAEALPAFEAEHRCKVHLQLMTNRVLQSRLQAALLTGAEVPDLVEIMNPNMGIFTRGPLADTGLVDLTDRIRSEGLDRALVASRFSISSGRGRIFALPHDVHPTGLCYRRDLVEALGIDVGTLRTWDDFVAMGQRLTEDLDHDGVPDRYALELSATGLTLPLLMRQRGEQVCDAAGRVSFDTPGTADTIVWYVHQMHGPQRLAYDPGVGQSMCKAMTDGLVLFYLTPDWRSRFFEMDTPNLKGKLALMPLPAWQPGGCRTTCWGGTGLAITKACPRPALAWELAKFLYLRPDQLGKRFQQSNIIPPLRAAWDLPELNAPSEFYSGQAVGRFYADLAPETPPEYVSACTSLAESKLTTTYLEAVAYYRRHGDRGLRGYVLAQLREQAGQVRRFQARDAFAERGDSPPATVPPPPQP